MLALGDLMDDFSMRPERTPPAAGFEPCLKYLDSLSDLSDGTRSVSFFFFSVDGSSEWISGTSEAVWSSARASVSSVVRCFLAYSLHRGRMIILSRDASL